MKTSLKTLAVAGALIALCMTPQVRAFAVSIAEVTGLQAALDARPTKGTWINGRAAKIDAQGKVAAVIAFTTDQCVTVAGNGVNCVVYAHAEVFTPTETQARFTIQRSPYPSTSGNPLVYRNGLLMAPGHDYDRSGMAVTFRAGQEPGPGDLVQVVYTAISK